MSIRIMHVVNNLGKGGLENGLVNLIQRMDHQSFQHIVCTVRGLGPNAERLPAERVRIVSLDTTGWRTRVQTPSLIRTMRAMQPDIVHSRNWSAIEAVFAARFARVPAIVHSEHGFEAESGAAEPRRRTLARRTAFQLADRVLTVSFQLRDRHAKRTGFSADKIGVIHNGVDCSRFSPDPQVRRRVRAELGIGEGELCIGCVANLLPVKAHLTLLKALDVHARSRSDWHVVLVGEGPLRATLMNYVDARPDWKDRVRFVGSSGRVPDLLRAMDVFVLPSLAEGICNSLLEALATGLAAAATAVGGNVEIVEDGHSGVLFKAGDVHALAAQLASLHAQPAWRTTLGINGRERVRTTFSIEAMVQAYEQMYLSLRPALAPAVLSPGYR